MLHNARRRWRRASIKTERLRIRAHHSGGGRRSHEFLDMHRQNSGQASTITASAFAYAPLPTSTGTLLRQQVRKASTANTPLPTATTVVVKAASHRHSKELTMLTFTGKKGTGVGRYRYARCTNCHKPHPDHFFFECPKPCAHCRSTEHKCQGLKRYKCSSPGFSIKHWTKR